MLPSYQPLKDKDGLHQLITLRDWVRWGAASFERAELCFGHGQLDAWDEATSLALHGLGIPLDEQRLDWTMALSVEQRGRVDALFQRRIQERRPAAYLMGETRFAGLRLLADERALVPRSPIAELIEAQYRPWARPDRVHRMLDLCTGGGCIAVASAAQLPGWRVDAVDLSEPALALARENVVLHGLGDRVRLIHSDLFGALSEQRYDLIVSNPPYVGSEAFGGLPQEFRHEPALGLLGGADGLGLVMRILAAAPAHLNAGGLLILEVGYSRAALEAALPAVPFTWLEFQRGGEGVFALEGEGLNKAQSEARAVLAQPGLHREHAHGG